MWVNELAVFPAPAGMNRALDNWTTTYAGVPRASGDEPMSEATEAATPSCSPRQRG